MVKETLVVADLFGITDQDLFLGKELLIEDRAVKDKHYVNKPSVEHAIEAHCPNCKTHRPPRYSVTRKHTVNLGTVTNANWEERYDDSFAYLANGPPPDNQPSNPSTRTDATVQGSVTSFSTEGALVFEGTYTTEGFSSSYTSTLGQTYTWP